MAISHKATGTAVFGANSVSPTIPSHVAGDLILIWVFGKPYNGAHSVSGFTQLGTTFTSGTNAAGVDIGSMAVTCYYKEAASGSETATVTEGSPAWNVFGALAQVWQKGGGESWDTPVIAGGGAGAAATFNIDTGTNPGITTGDFVSTCAAFNTDSATPCTTHVTQTATGVTFTNTHDPATDPETATGGDMGVCLNRASVSGTASANLFITGDPAVTPEVAVAAVRMRVSSGLTVTGAALSMTPSLPVASVEFPGQAIQSDGDSAAAGSSVDLALPSNSTVGSLVLLFAYTNDTGVDDITGWSRDFEHSPGSTNIVVFRKEGDGSTMSVTVTSGSGANLNNRQAALVEYRLTHDDWTPHGTIDTSTGSSVTSLQLGPVTPPSYPAFGAASPGLANSAGSDPPFTVTNDWKVDRPTQAVGNFTNSRAAATTKYILSGDADTTFTWNTARNATGVVGVYVAAGAQTVTGVALAATPSLPVGSVAHSVTGVALAATPSLPAGTLDHRVTGTALSATPTLPTGTVSAAAGGQTVTGVALSAAPSLPAGSLRHAVTGVVLTATPTLPAGATSHRLTGVALSVPPALPAGALRHAITGVTLSATPSLPAARLDHKVTGVALSATPTLPPGTVSAAGAPQTVTGVALSATPTLPAGALVHRIAGVALSATPSLPSGTVTVAGVTITGVALTATPYLPPGEALWTGSAVYDGTGSVTWGTDRITVDSAGSGDFWGTADAGAIVYRPLVGGVDEVHLLSFPTSGHPRLFQLRKSAAANAAMYAILLDGDGSHITTVWRDTDGASAGFAGENTGIPRIAGTPLWLRITYSGSTATAYASQNSGATWQQVGTRSVSGLTLAGVTNGGGTIGAVTTVVDRGAGLVHQLAGATLAVAPLLPVGAVAAGDDWHRIDGTRTQDWHRLEGATGDDWHRLGGTHAGDHHRLDDTHSGDWHRQDGSGRGDWHRQE